MLVAITRGIGASLASCELTHVARTPIDLDLARAQHASYEAALERAGCRLVRLPPLDDCPDAVFVEDAAVVLDETAIVTRPGADSRRGEVASVAEALESYRPVARIDVPGTLDGGDVLRLGRRIYVGLSGRSNQSGIEQLRALLAPHGYEVTVLPVTGCLHLKSAVTEVAPGVLLVNRKWVDAAAFADVSVIEVDPTEPYAANGLLIAPPAPAPSPVEPRPEDVDRAGGLRPLMSTGGRGFSPGAQAGPEGPASMSVASGLSGRNHSTLIYPASFPRTCARLEALGITLEIVDVSELQKAEGAVTCCSLVFRE